MGVSKYYIHAIFLLAVSALFFPFWLTTLFAVIFVFLFENFYPAPIVFFIMDAIYSFENIKVGLFFGSITIFSIIAFLLINFLKNKVIISK